MGRPPRISTGDVVYHVLNRSNGGRRLFRKSGDYQAFEKVLEQAKERVPVRIVTYCIMPNHWHMVLWPNRDGDLSDFMRWLTLTHAQRWHAAHRTTGRGHLYQGRFKSLPVQCDKHFLTACRYVEGNPVRAGLVKRAERWRWCGLFRRNGSARQRELLSSWPVPRPSQWEAIVNDQLPERELQVLNNCVQRGRPFGSATWVARTVDEFGLESSVRPRGRPRKALKKGS